MNTIMGVCTDCGRGIALNGYGQCYSCRYTIKLRVGYCGTVIAIVKKGTTMLSSVIGLNRDDAIRLAHLDVERHQKANV